MLIYFAGPLFSQAERHFNQQLTQKLEQAGFQVFLPQRDGPEMDKPPYNSMPREQWREAVFQIDKTQVLAADIFLFILDGRIPDEGACVELGIAYCQKDLQQSRKLLVGLQTDMRATLLGSGLNPMIHVPLEYIAQDEDHLLKALQHYRAHRALPQ